MHACMHVCMYVCMYIYIYMHIYISLLNIYMENVHNVWAGPVETLPGALTESSPVQMSTGPVGTIEQVDVRYTGSSIGI